MNKLIFTWDDDKNISNKRKHDISFEEAQTVFFDEIAIEKMILKFELSQQGKQLKRSKFFISGGYHEKRI